ISRSRGGTPFTTRPPIEIVPSVGSSRPAMRRSAVDFPHPEGPTRTRNSPPATSRSSPERTRVSPYALPTFSRRTPATRPPLPDVRPMPPAVRGVRGVPAGLTIALDMAIPVFTECKRLHWRMRDARTPPEIRRPRPRRGRREARAVSATIREVARAACFWVATVSRVLNGKGPVREVTSRRVRAAADRLRYVPHGGARSLITRRTNAIGVLLPDLFGEFFSEAIRGIDRAARGAGYQLLVSGSHGDRAQAETALRAMRGRVDGLIVMSPSVDGPTLSANLPEGWPVLLLNCAVDGAAFDSINIDNEGGAAAMVKHLAGLGHRRIAHVTGPADNWDARERLRGYRRAVQAEDGEDARELEVPGDFTEESGYRAARRVLGIRPPPTAIFAANDSM